MIFKSWLMMAAFALGVAGGGVEETVDDEVLIQQILNRMKLRGGAQKDVAEAAESDEEEGNWELIEAVAPPPAESIIPDAEAVALPERTEESEEVRMNIPFNERCWAIVNGKWEIVRCSWFEEDGKVVLFGGQQEEDGGGVRVAAAAPVGDGVGVAAAAPVGDGGGSESGVSSSSRGAVEVQQVHFNERCWAIVNGNWEIVRCSWFESAEAKNGVTRPELVSEEEKQQVQVNIPFNERCWAIVNGKWEIVRCSWFEEDGKVVLFGGQQEEDGGGVRVAAAAPVAPIGHEETSVLPKDGENVGLVAEGQVVADGLSEHVGGSEESESALLGQRCWRYVDGRWRILAC